MPQNLKNYFYILSDIENCKKRIATFHKATNLKDMQLEIMFCMQLARELKSINERLTKN